MMLLNIELSPRKHKRFVALFKDDDKLHKIHFGFKSPDGTFGSTYIDHRDDVKKANYIARHGANETWDDPMTPATLSRFILWEKPTLREAISAYRKRFKL